MAIILLSACGNTSHSQSKAPVHAVAGGKGTGIAHFLAGPGEEPGFSEAKAPIVSSSLSYWASSFASPGYAAQLRADGWQSRAEVGLVGANRAGGASSVDEFSSPTGAKANEAQELGADATGYGIGATAKPVRLTIPGVPSAGGYAAPSGPEEVAVIAWVEGRCTLYLVNHASRHEPRRVFLKPLLAGVKAIYHRTAGTCP